MSNLKYNFRVIFYVLSIFILDSCQIRPLYYHNSNKELIDQIISIDISLATSHIEQKVRNHLFFLIFHGSSIKQQFKYKLILNITSNASDVFLINYSGKVQSGRVTLTANYSLQNFSDGKILYKNSSSTTSLFDFSEQEFSKIRTVRNAEERASKELAENVYLDLILVSSSFN